MQAVGEFTELRPARIRLLRELVSPVGSWPLRGVAASSSDGCGNSGSLLHQQHPQMRWIGPATSVANGVSVRVTGEIAGVASPWVLLQADGGRLWVDVTALAEASEAGGAACAPRCLRVGGLLQAVGELDSGCGVTERGGAHGGACGTRSSRGLPPAAGDGPSVSPFILRARILRAVDGLDMQLYERCLQARRAFQIQHCPESEDVFEKQEVFDVDMSGDR
eukprot:TRINITY_DN18807_c0_g1_i1.p1 TRINITY_DN18807_c0_g1~~TRINITY_DN18807_c0_g1_i1.p1  ORF type:complete len:221 (+),score=36.93 TRINITY_DN18807_c0_g1_i1:120-782(+)